MILPTTDDLAPRPDRRNLLVDSCLASERTHTPAGSVSGDGGDLSIPDRWRWTSQLLNAFTRSTRSPRPSGPTSPARPRPETRPAASRGNHPCANAAGTAHKIN